MVGWVLVAQGVLAVLAVVIMLIQRKLWHNDKKLLENDQRILELMENKNHS